uniref:Uncharacterized protein n=1 Tax=Globodera rostochiensis TaxID=31243 RepID=A0A914H5Y7_GLORO
MEAIFDDLTFPWVSSPLPHQLLQKMNILGIEMDAKYSIWRHIWENASDGGGKEANVPISVNVLSKQFASYRQLEFEPIEASCSKEPTLPLFHSVSNSKKMSLILSAVCEPLNFRMASVYFFLA